MMRTAGNLLAETSPTLNNGQVFLRNGRAKE